MTHATCPDCEHARRLHALVAADDLDAAIEAGLMTYAPCTGCDGIDRSTVDTLLQAQARLRTAWEARERHRQRNARLARRAAEREARRLAAAPQAAAAQAPALPTAAAEILARAKARAAERMKR
ncbi:hypothetical protein [Pseudoxanthomonas putridarboris]|uniref:Transcription factor zinc-finger domain-containing protein n=1 Tax=Pseudoxanthomonas putridarboris TaxID=752605 RepID=A0ABU9IZ67_9GAMM